MTAFPTATAPVAVPTAPARALPPGAVDTHVHMVGRDYPLWDQRVEDPAAGDLTAWLGRFAGHQRTLGLDRTVVVHSILYGADNAITLDTVQRLGQDRARAIVLVADGADARTLDPLAAAGAAGVRLNYVHGGILSWPGAVAMAPALAERGLHIQMLAHAHQHVAEIAPAIRALPVPVVFDHIAWPDLSLGVADPGFQALLSLVADGHAYVKLSGIYRVCPPPYTAADPFVAALIAANPARCLWGSDWPHLMLADAGLPDAGVLLNRLLALADDATLARILVSNPGALYGFDGAGPPQAS